MVAGKAEVDSMKMNRVPLRVGIDARLYQEKGLGRYIKNLLENLQEIDKKNKYFIFLLKDDFRDLKFAKNFHKILADFRWYTVKEQLQFPKILNSYDLDLLHVPHFNVPIFYSGKMVVTIHDLIHQHVDTRASSTHNLLVYKIKKIAYKKVFQTALSKSKKVITVSKYVKKQLEEEWGVPSKNIIVTYEGVDEEFLRSGSSAKDQQSRKILENFKIKPPYIFYVGNAHPHKNLGMLINTFLDLRQRFQYLQLVLSGDDNYFWPRIRRNYKHKDIIYTGKVSDKELAVLYKGAEAFVTASLEEGFGLPLLESFAIGTPVVSSNSASLPEIGGEAALYFDPRNKEDMVEKIQKVLNDLKLKRTLIENGRRRVKQFSWKKMAKETLEIYESV